MARKTLAAALAAILSAHAAVAWADSTIHGYGTATTTPIPALSCIEVDQGPGTDTKLCPGNAAGWAAAFGFGPLALSASISAALDTIGATQGGLLYRGPSTWNYLSPGTSGQFLETLGAGNNPLWATPLGGGGSGTVGSGTGPALAQYGAGTTTAVGPESVSAAFSNPQGGPLDLAANGVTNAKLAQSNPNTVKANFTGALGNEAAYPVPPCSGANQALNYASGTGLGCVTFAGGGAAHYFTTTTTVAGTNAYTATTAEGGWTNTAGRVFCGPYANASTGAATLSLDGQTALPINVQLGNSTTTQAGSGDIPGGNIELCVIVNPGATAFVKETQVPGGLIVLTSGSPNHLVTPFEWTTGYTIIGQSGSPNVTFPSVVGNLSNQSGIVLVPIVPMVMTPNPADVINGGPAGPVTMAAGHTEVASVNASGPGLNIPLGEVKTFPWSWGPNQNLSITAIPLVDRAIPTIAVGANCMIGPTPVPSPATAVMIHIPSGTVPTVTGGNTIATCNAAGPANTIQSALALTNTAIPAGDEIWVIGQGAGWAGTITSISGRIEISLMP